MVKAIFFTVWIALAATAYAEQYTTSVRGNYGFVELGHRYDRMVNVLGEPLSSYHKVVYDKDGYAFSGIAYRYHKNNLKYEIVFVHGAVFSISWER